MGGSVGDGEERCEFEMVSSARCEMGLGEIRKRKRSEGVKGKEGWGERAVSLAQKEGRRGPDT